MVLVTDVGGSLTESYVTANMVIEYAGNHRDKYASVITADVTSAIEPACRRATVFIDGLGRDQTNQENPTWPGQRSTGSQLREWPRVNATYSDGVSIVSAEVPQQVILATLEAACYEIQNVGMLQEVIKLSEVSKSTRIGGISESTMGAMKIEDARQCLTLVKDYLSAILRMPDDNHLMFITNTEDSRY